MTSVNTRSIIKKFGKNYFPTRSSCRSFYKTDPVTDANQAEYIQVDFLQTE